jgi:outer membrane immunogenic protein
MKKLFLGNDSSGSPTLGLPSRLADGLRAAAMLTGVAAMAASLAAPALAADMPMPVKASGPPIVWDWTEFYFGVHIGYADASTSWCTTLVVANCAADRVSQDPYGYAIGGQFGYRYQISNLVIGAEYQLDGLAINQTSPSPADPNGTRYSAFNNLQSLTGQAGVAWDRTLLYGKGGGALTKVNFDAANTVTGLDVSTAQWKWVDGWTVGGGLEYLLWTHVSIGVEYDYYRFNIGNYTNILNNAGGVVGCAFCSFGKSDVQTITARLNVKLWPWGP